MKLSLRSRLTLLAITLLSCLVAGEIALRLVSHRDSMGNLHVFNTVVMPYRLSVQHTQELVDLGNTSKITKLVYDQDLGWSPRPGLPPHNAHGFLSIRRVVDPERPADRLRVALAGSSYTRGADAFGWWRVVEHELNMNDQPAEVLNFAVNGYGMDQTYLRWKRDIRPFHPHVVLFCFTAGLASNNINVIRQLRDPETGIPYTKPRFLLEGDNLRLVNSPTVAPNAIPALIGDVAKSPLAGFDRFWLPQCFEPRWWRASRLVAFIEAKTDHTWPHVPESEFYRMDSEPVKVSLRIIRQFRDEVEASGSHFVIAHLPHYFDLVTLQRTGRLPFEEFYRALQEIAPVIPLEKPLLAACEHGRIDRGFEKGHYSGDLEGVVGGELSAWLRAHENELRADVAKK